MCFPSNSGTIEERSFFSPGARDGGYEGYLGGE